SGDGDAANETFVNQGVTDSDQTEPGLTDSNGDPSDGLQPTEIDATTGAGAPALDVEKRWRLAIDNDGDGLVDPGDTLAYSITVSNTGSAAAINARVSDAAPPDTTLVAGSVSTDRGVVVSETPIDVNLGDLPPGDVAIIRFEVTVDGGTPDGTIIPNQATVSGDNFTDEPSDDNGNDDDGKNPTLTPVDTGGGSGDPGGLSKELSASSEAGSATTDVLVGEVVTFRVSVEVPAGLLREVSFSDTLPVGLSYLSGTAQLSHTFDTGLNAANDPGAVNAAGSDVFVSLIDGSEFVANGQALEVYLGDVINSDNDANAEAYTLEYQALVENIAGNQAGSALSNSASLSYLTALNQPASLTPVTVTLDVIEPNVQVSKAAAPAAILPSGGDVVYTVVVSNAVDAAPAYDVVVADPIPTGWDLTTVDSITPAGGASGITNNSNLPNDTLSINIAVLPAGASVTIVYTVQAPSGLTAGDIISNTATGTWTSLPGSNGTGDATPGSSGDTDGERNGSSAAANDYTTSDMADVRVGQPELTKTVLNRQTRYAIGDLVEYQLNLSMP
ncbi:MAG: DUF11 domain-containing protein, partial [Candidatus Competibacteraceae bacterium]|nr:DUF11 domain-containing protein [Candidatus Competibacteraceae bacterium]